MLKTKTFDCVKMKREGGRRIHEKIKNMTPKQELAFWKERTAELDRKIKASNRRPAPR